MSQKYQKEKEEFEKKFVPLMPGFSVSRDWTKDLEGTTANYMTLWTYIQNLLEKREEEILEEVEKRRRRDIAKYSKLGGYAVLKKYGKKKMTEWGKLGGRPKNHIEKDPFISEVKNSKAPEWYKKEAIKIHKLLK